MSNQRSWTWLDDSNVTEEQMDDLEPTLNALAGEWSDIHNEIEREGWRNQARYEDDGGGPENPECPHCDRGYIGFLNHNFARAYVFCAHCREERPENPQLVLLTCPHCNGEGVDREAMAEEAKRARQIDANRQVRIEVIEEMLARYGARMMRAYEHWNEDERYMEYMERER